MIVLVIGALLSFIFLYPFYEPCDGRHNYLFETCPHISEKIIEFDS